jgi:hypothetical protein
VLGNKDLRETKGRTMNEPGEVHRLHELYGILADRYIDLKHLHEEAFPTPKLSCWRPLTFCSYPSAIDIKQNWYRYEDQADEAQ